MAVYPKIVKPWRGYPSSNTIMAIRLRVNQAPVADASGMVPLGTVKMVAGKPYHIGTIPKGAFVFPALMHTKTVFNGTTPTMVIGSQADDDGFVTDTKLATLGVTEAAAGALTGILAADTPVWALPGALTGNTAGEVDIVIPFYIQKD